MKKVLIVDDEKDIRIIFDEIFRHDYGFENITFAQDGLEAFTECSLQKFDIITLDHMMPFMKGAEFLIALRNKPGLNQKTPVTMISAFIPELSETITSIENTYFLEKPVDFTRLSRYVKMSLKVKDAV
ncbi:MAG: response regulator [Bacteriovorax sp.]|nr:response regulator [Bacteriovorax sp.]